MRRIMSGELVRRPRRSSGSLRAGVSLVEALAALTLSSLVVTLVVGMCSAQMRLANVTAARAVATETTRTVNAVLSGEARRSTAADVHAWSSDSLAIRSFRGTALSCGTATGLLVRYAGDRLPEPEKDSVLVVQPAGDVVLGLFDSRPADGSCPVHGDETVLEWRLDGAVPTPAVLLVFESGSYHLSARALRYRIGSGGRQPLTAEVLRHPFSRFTAGSERGIRFQLDADGHASVHTAMFAPFAGPQ